MNISIDPLTAQDVIDVASTAINHDDIAYEDLVRNAVRKEGMPGFTVRIDGDLIGVCGVFPFYRHRGEAWAMITSDGARRYGYVIAGISKEIVRRFHEEFGFVRLEAPIPVGLTLNLRYAEWVGFGAEGVMERAGVYGEDVMMMASIKEPIDAKQ